MKVGDRVQLHPATDLWMMGAKYGTIVKIGRKLIHVDLDKWRPKYARSTARCTVVKLDPSDLSTVEA